MHAGIARLPVQEMSGKRTRKRPADDRATHCRKRERAPLSDARAGRQRLDCKSRDHCHDRAEDGAKKPRVTSAYRGLAFLAPVRGIPRTPFVRPFDDLRRVVGFLAASRTAENQRVPFPKLHDPPCISSTIEELIGGLNGGDPSVRTRRIKTARSVSTRFVSVLMLFRTHTHRAVKSDYGAVQHRVRNDVLDEHRVLFWLPQARRKRHLGSQ